MPAGHLRANSQESASGNRMSKWVIVGWLISLAGSVLWLYGYLSIGSPPLIDWYSMAPYWFTQLFRTIECEAGMTFGIAGTLLIAWPHLR